MLIREWAVMGVFALLLAVCLFISRTTQVRAQKALAGQVEQPQECLFITLSGAVLNENKHPCRPGTTVKELLRGVPLAPSADRKKIPYRKVLYTSQTLEIPEKNGSSRGQKKISLEEK